MHPSQTEAISKLVERWTAIPGAQLNEASTRLVFINEVLAKVLGWHVEEFDPEKPVAAWSPNDGKKKREYLDYHLQHGQSLRLVVEAKRAGKVFALPTSRKLRKLPLKQLKDNHGNVLSQTIRQAEHYCQAIGTQGFVVTNGSQWVASLAFAHHVRSEDLQAIVFFDLEDIRSNLQEFVDLLSPDGIASQNLMSKAVSGQALVPSFASRLNEALRPASPDDKRNYLIGPMTVLMGTCFGDLTDDEHAQMLEECYVSSEVTDEHLKRLESFVGDTLPRDLISAGKIQRASENALVEIETRTGTSVLVVGRAGSGKSTFLAISRKRMQSKPETQAQKVLLHIDLMSLTQTHASNFDHDRLVDEVCHDILVQAETRYPKLNPFQNEHLRHIFAGEIKRLQSSLPSALRSAEECERLVNTTG